MTDPDDEPRYGWFWAYPDVHPMPFGGQTVAVDDTETGVIAYVSTPALAIRLIDTLYARPLEEPDR